jgi:hypothetical protein
MTCMVADFNCMEPLFRLMTTPVPADGDRAELQRLLARYTGHQFATLGEAGLGRNSGVAS